MPDKPQELRCDKSLLDSNFEGYKLSLNEIPNRNYELPSEVHKLQHAGDQYSYLYLTLFSMHNHLSCDPWNSNSLYYINEKSAVTKIIFQSIDGCVDNFRDLLTLPLKNNEDQKRPYNRTLVFAGSSTAVVSDGLSSLHIISTGDRSLTEAWTIECTSTPLGDDNSFTLLDARYVENSNQVELHCLLIAIVENREEKLIVSKASTNLHWIVFKKMSDKSWNLENEFRMNSKGLVKYAYFSPQCESVFIESTKPIELPTKSTNANCTKDSTEKKDPQFYWQQSKENIMIWFALPRGILKDDIDINITDTCLSINIKTEEFLKGNLFQRVDADLTTWSIAENRGEIILWKREAGQMWNYLIEVDERGEEVIDPELVKEIHERFSHMCSDKEVLSDNTTPAFNPGQLEACDNAPEEDSRLVAINALTQKITHEVVLGGHQKLFNLRVSFDEAPYLCVRHDVDGTLWEMNCKRDQLCKHVGTLNAFGYILASKQWKYATCSPDLSYAVIAPTKQNLFVYKQNCAVNSQLKNRKTGHSYSEVGKQFLVTLNANEEIIGIFASNDYLFVLQKNKIFVYHMKDVE